MEMKVKFKVLGLICSLTLFTSTMAVHAKDLPADPNDPNGGCDCCTMDIDESERQVDYQAIAEYIYLAEHAELFNAQQALKNPFRDALHMMRRGSVIKQGWAGNNVTRYYQNDYPNDLLCPISQPQGPTIKDGGCVVTSFSMIVSKYGIISDPLETRTVINRDAPGTDSACRFPWYGVVTIPKFKSIHYNDITVPGKFKPNQYAMIEGAILNNRPVLVHMYHPDPNIDPHAVVVYGYEYYSDGGKFHYIFNPSRDNPRTTLEDYENAGYMINQVMVYWK